MLKIIGLVLGCLFFMAGCTEQTPPLRIAAASNMQFVMGALTQDYNTKFKDSVQVITGSSGKLTTQIKQGAPFDLFLAADLSYPEALFNAGLTIDSPKHYATGKLVLWTQGSNQVLSSSTLKTHTALNNLAIPNPEIAPYGRAAIECLDYYGVLEALNTKLIYGENIAQTNQFVYSGATTIGFTTLAAIRFQEYKDAFKGSYFIMPDSCHNPITQTAVILKNSKQLNLAQQFYNYLFSDSAREILKNYGYSLPN